MDLFLWWMIDERDELGAGAPLRRWIVTSWTQQEFDHEPIPSEPNTEYMWWENTRPLDAV